MLCPCQRILARVDVDSEVRRGSGVCGALRREREEVIRDMSCGMRDPAWRRASIRALEGVLIKVVAAYGVEKRLAQAGVDEHVEWYRLHNAIKLHAS